MQNYKIATWADYISVHLLPGEAILDSIKDICIEYNVKVFVIYEMSSKENLINHWYKRKAKEIIFKYNDIVTGAVTQSFINNKILHITPGMSLTTDSDNNGPRESSCVSLPRTEMEACNRLCATVGGISGPSSRFRPTI